jgi:hypothetical protein
VRAARAEFPTGKLIRVTLLNLTPVAVGLAASVHYFGRRQPDWVFWWLSITYGLACYGSLKAWWIPYLFGADAARIAREQGLYGATHSFLPERHGIRPNTLHMAFDAATLGILVGLTISRL